MFSIIANKVANSLLSQFDRILSACERLIAKEESTFQTCSCHLSQRQELWVILPKINQLTWRSQWSWPSLGLLPYAGKGWLIGNEKDLFWGEGIKNKRFLPASAFLGKKKGTLRVSDPARDQGRATSPLLLQGRLAAGWSVASVGWSTPPAKLKSSSCA